MLRELNKESLLLLYLSDELSAEDRAEVDRQLAADAALRADLDRLSGALDTFESGMAMLDAHPVPTESAMVRRIGVAMRQRIADRMTETASTPVAAERGPRYPWWAYPAAAAAILVIAFLGYWGHQPDKVVKVLPREQPFRTPNLPGVPSPFTAIDPRAIIKAPGTTPDESQVAEMGDNFEDGNSTQPEKSVASLDVAEHHLAELTRSRDRMTPSVFGFNDSNE